MRTRSAVFEGRTMHRELDPAGALLIPLLAVLALGAAVPKDPPPLASKRPVTDRYFDIEVVAAVATAEELRSAG